MSYRIFLFIKRLYRNDVLKTYGELNRLNECTKCDGTGFMPFIGDEGLTEYTQCPFCGGYGDYEEDL